MLAYAANAPRFAERRRNRPALLLIVGAHVLALAGVMSARMEMPVTGFDPTTVISIPDKKPPPPEPLQPEPRTEPRSQPVRSTIDQVKQVVPIEPSGPVMLDPPVSLPPLGPVAGTATLARSHPPIAAPKRVGPRFATPEWALKPPYPMQKRQLEEEATLKLRLSIDDQGRVVDVEPVGNVDPVFLAAARKHLIAKWRYKPATEDGRPVHSSTVVTLRFELEA